MNLPETTNLSCLDSNFPSQTSLGILDRCVSVCSKLEHNVFPSFVYLSFLPSSLPSFFLFCASLPSRSHQETLSTPHCPLSAPYLILQAAFQNLQPASHSPTNKSTESKCPILLDTKNDF